mmetsp:Transcript_13365/g.19261  ORF Transcript_13365/g.19261 Transcript_13365/m.19261 type:complete len:341 (-) Transcript_13365:74-1096(-)
MDLLSFANVGFARPFQCKQHCRRLCTRGSSEGNGESAKSPSARAIEDFLTQRSLQTLLFYLEQCRDVPSFRFLEGFKDHEGIFRYHGFNGLRVHWDEYLTELLREPKRTITVRNPNYRRGGSKGNPYVQRHQDVEMTLDPKALGQKLLQVREHLSDEFIADLMLIRDENEELRRRHQHFVLHDVDTVGVKLYPAKERESVYHANSPFRAGNYDLLKTYSVYLAVHRTLEMMDRDYKQRDSFNWLASFLDANGSKFHGDSGYHVGDEFISAMWDELPRMKKNRGGSVSMIDPDSIVEKILHERLRVADDWTTELMSVPRDNLQFQRIPLEDLLRDADAREE